MKSSQQYTAQTQPDKYQNPTSAIYQMTCTQFADASSWEES